MTLKQWLAAALVLGLSTGCPGDDDTDPVDSDTEQVETGDTDEETDVEATCADEADAETCIECCADENPTGVAALRDAVFDACACAVEAPCAEVCTVEGNDLCADGTPTQACQQCLGTEVQNQQSVCANAGAQACMNDGTCADLVTCGATCQ